MATILPNAVSQFIGQDGAPLAGGEVYMYIPSTTVFKDTFQDSGGTILNTNPIILDAAGEAIIYGSGAYRQVVYDANGDLVWDQLTADTSVGGFAWGGVTTGTGNAQVGDASSFSSQDGQQYGFIAGFSNSGPMTINPGGSGAIPVLRDSPLGPVPCVGGEVVADNECTLVYEAARGAFHLTNPALGTLATQNANAVAITGGTIAGVTITTSTVTQPTLTLKQASNPTPTAEGDAQWSTLYDTINVGDGAATKRFWSGPPPGALYGCTIANNASDATNDIDFAAGFAADSTNAYMMRLASGLTKRLDAAWAVGTNQGGLFSGSIANTSYHAFLILDPATGTVDAGFDTSATAANRPVAYTLYRRVGSFIRSGGTILAFIQNGDNFTLSVPVSIVDATNPGTSAQTFTNLVPTGISVEAVIAALLADSGTATSNTLLITSLAQPNTTPTLLLFDFYILADTAASANSSGVMTVRTDTSGQARYRLFYSDSLVFVRIVALGWNDTRGRMG